MSTKIPIIIALASLLSLFAGQSHAAKPVKLSEHVSLIPGPVNGVMLGKGYLVVYGDPTGKIKDAEMVLFTHSRRDVVWAGRKLVENGAMAFVPEGDADKFASPEKFWSEFTTRRFHDYAQQGTKIPPRPFENVKTVKEGESITYRRIPIKVLDTPGYMRSAVSYFIEIDDTKYGFVGDIIYANGQLLDLYSLQDAVKEANIGGYHGWAGRMGQLIESLRKVAAEDCDILVPARGPVIRNPKQAIDLLIARLQKVYEKYLSISAGRWYFKTNYDILAARVLGPTPKVNWMPWAETINKKPPEWITPIGNSRLIISKDRRGFLVDCGSKRIVEQIVKLKDAGKLTGLDGLFITHYHDDHTNDVAACLQEFHCPVYSTGKGVDILENPGNYRLPCLTMNPIRDLKAMPEGHKMRWKEFNFTFHDFPGQTIYHAALLVEKDDAEKIFFVGDSFTPSGIDDYCLQNRNLLHENMGYFYCLDMVRKMPAGTLLINEHVTETFRFSPAQLDLMTDTLNKRKDLLAQLFPFDDANYGIDERWARFFPYHYKSPPARTIPVNVKILNHSQCDEDFEVTLNLPQGFRTKKQAAKITVPPKTERQIPFEVTTKKTLPPGTYIITANIKSKHHTLNQWTEAIIQIE